MVDEVRTTIGVMARAPLPGHCKSRLAAHVGARFAADLCRVMLLDTLDRIQKVMPSSRLVVMGAPENDGVAVLRTLVPSRWEVIAQRGDGLGARLGHAFTTLGALPGVTALVDADSPTAPWDVAARALAGLRQPRGALMGPCEDGGYWLIATTQVELGILDDIAWSTPAVAEQTRARCRALGIELEETASAFDVDEPRDVERLRAELAIRPDQAPLTAAFLVERP